MRFRSRRSQLIVRFWLALLLLLNPGSETLSALPVAPPPAPALGSLGIGLAARLGSAAALGSIAAVLLGRGSAEATPAANGIPWTWGDDNQGQLGNALNQGTNSSVPTETSGLSGITSIAAGNIFGLAARGSDGTVWAWGDNTYGELGNGATDTNAHTTPSQVPVPKNVIQVAAGTNHGVALDANGAVWTWGDDNCDQLGVRPAGASDFSPNTVQGLPFIKEIAASGWNTYALDSSGNVWAWGNGASGVLGDGVWADHCVGVPAIVFRSAVAVAAGNHFVLAIDSSGTLWSWGDNTWGELGAIQTDPNESCNQGSCSLVPIQVQGLPAGVKVRAVAAGDSHSLAIGSDRNVYAWGKDDQGQLGPTSVSTCNNTPCSVTPVLVTGIGGGTLSSRVVAIAGGYMHSVAATADGTVWGWGSNVAGELGNGIAIPCGGCTSPTPVSAVGTGGTGTRLGGLVAAGDEDTFAVNGPLSTIAAPAGSACYRPTPGYCGADGGDPVQPLSGNYTYTKNDLAIPGRGPTPQFVRAYNSGDGRVSTLGPGWTDNYNIRLDDPGSGACCLILEGSQGRSDCYTANGDGTYAPPQGVNTSLLRHTDGTFVATLPDQTTWTFRQDGLLTAITDRYGNVSNLAYNGQLELVAVSDPAGRGSLSFGYDPSGHLTSVSDWQTPNPRVVQFQYDAYGRLWKVTDRDGQVTTYGYDGISARLSTITDANTHVAITNTYGTTSWDTTDERVLTQKDALNNQTSFNYVQNQDGTISTTLTYPPTSFDGFAPTVVDHYSTSGQLSSQVVTPSNTDGSSTTSYTYDTNGNLSTVTDPLNNVTAYCYDVDYSGNPIAGSLGNLTRKIDPVPTTGANLPVTLFKYDAKNNLIETMSPKGVNSGTSVSCSTNLASAINTAYATDNAYDVQGITLQSVTRHFTDPDLGLQTAITSFQYGDSNNPGRVTKVIPPRGNVESPVDSPIDYSTNVVYFASGSEAGMIESQTDALGNETTYTYDPVGRTLTMVDPNGNVSGGTPSAHTWSYTYDDEDRLLSTLAPAPTSGGNPLVTSSTYDPVGNRIVAIDANGQVTTYLYDQRDSLSEVDQSPLAWTNVNSPPSTVYKTTYAYDNLGNLSQVTRAAGDATNERATSYVYDGLNRLRSETQYPSWPTTTPTLVTTYTYDADSNRLTLLDPKGQTTADGYDHLNRLTSISYSDGVTPNVAYSYDANGNRLSMQDGTGTTTYAYDEFDRPTSITRPGSSVVGYCYDLDGNRSKIIYPDGTAVSYAFNQGEQLASLSDWASRTTSYQYTPDGSLKQTTNVNGTTANYTYDNALRLTQVSNQNGSSIIDQHSYILDNLGNRLQVQETLASAGGQTPYAWGLNSAGQLGTTSGTTCAGGTVACSTVPLAVNGTGGNGNLSGIVALAGGGAHTLAVKSDGTVWAWGDNTSGQLGNGTVSPSSFPVQVSSLGNVVAVAVGYRFSLALKSDGTVWAWGANGAGQLGIGSADTNAHPLPVQVSGLSGVKEIAAGTAHALAEKSDGSAAWAWGDNTNGEIGDGTTNQRTSPVSVQLPSGASWSSFAAGDNYSLAVRSDGTVWAWGLNAQGQLGDTSSGSPVEAHTPVQVLTLTNVVGISAGYRHALAVTRDGTVWSWGDNAAGQLGNGTTTEANEPIQVGGFLGQGTLGTIVSVAAGTDDSFALSANGVIYGWGVNADGELGNGSTQTRFYPFPVSSPQGMSNLGPTQVTAGYYHTLALATTHQVTTSYTYDHLYRITNGGIPGNPSTYRYDPVGNRLSVSYGNGSPIASTYDKADRIQTVGSNPYSVDADGNLTAFPNATLAYDQANRLTSATISGTTTTYVYDGDGKRASQTAGTTTTSYAYDANRSLPVVLTDGSLKYVWGNGLAYATDTSGNLQDVYHDDGLGSVRAITDANDNIAQTYQTDEFGVSALVQGTNSQPFGFTGEQTDSSTGFSYLRARSYAPALGRFLTRDSVFGTKTDPLSLDRYVYTQDNATNRIDPSGLDPCGWGFGPNEESSACGGMVSLGAEESTAISSTDTAVEPSSSEVGNQAVNQANENNYPSAETGGIPANATTIANEISDAAPGPSIRIGKVTKSSIIVQGQMYVGGDPFRNDQGRLPQQGADGTPITYT